MNDLFRAHVTSTAFNLSLGKTQVAALVQLDRMLAEDRYFHPAGARNIFNAFVPGIRGLMDRGLVTHTMPQKKNTMDIPISKIWSITAAGRLVIELLKESGLYQEYSGELDARQKLGEQRRAEAEEQRYNRRRRKTG